MYRYFIKELANKFQGQFERLGENTEKYKTFSVTIEKEITKISKNGNGSVTISYKIKFIDSTRFMASSLSNLVDNVRERINKIKCKDCDCFREYESVKDNFYLAMNIVQTSFMKKLKKQFRYILKFFDNDFRLINLFCC